MAVPCDVDKEVIEGDGSALRTAAATCAHIPVVQDQNGGDPSGVKQGTMIVDGSFERSSSYDSYYQAAQHRPNLNVRDRAIVVIVIFDGDTLDTDEVRAVWCIVSR